ncbi:uncharacterized protein LOC128667814 [Microplitis demolitor]|uniref:uncharacterized protein LOC128667814 n=1 Tax=Microplitis demolitor TaxID=69319 RepID=UPI00235B6731|nr:uncharacterized protein LOC128667814 [Microplitis demolitor]
MKILVKIFIISTIVTLSKSCAVLYTNRVEKQSNNVNLSAWTVLINKNSLFIKTLEPSYWDYGSLVHPQAVLTLNTSILNKPKTKYTCIGGCWIFHPAWNVNINNCQVRKFSKIINGRINDTSQANSEYNTYAIIILKSPFYLNDQISVINLAKSDNVNDYSNCYFYAITKLIINENNFKKDKMTLMAPYKAQLINDSARIFKYDGVNYTHVAENSLDIKESKVIFVANYRASPLVCQLNNSDNYAHIGFFNIYIDTTKPFNEQRWESFINITSAHDEIYNILTKNFIPAPKG